MNTRTKLIICSFLLAFAAGCVKEEALLENSPYDIVARMEIDSQTRTSLSGLQGDMYYPLWSAGDEIAVFVDGDPAPSKFVLSSGEGATKATFAGSRMGNDYRALYPYSDTAGMENGILYYTLPSVQQYVAGSFGPGCYPMVARGTSEGLDFMNLCSVMKISITGEAALRSITLKAKDETIYLSGTASVDSNYDAYPHLQMLEGGSNSVTLDCKGTELAKDSATDFHIVLPAQTYKGGFDIIIDAYTDTIVKSVTSDLEFKRSRIRHLKGMELDLQMDEHQKQLAIEKAALIEFYKALDGDNWREIWGNQIIPNRNWCSDLPVYQWEGITVNQEGYVIRISLPGSSLSGEIPREIGNLKYLEKLYLHSNNISGNIPDNLFDITNLEVLSLQSNRLSGKIPEKIGDLTKLVELTLDGNEFEGHIPESICNLTKLVRLQLGDNLTGEIPENIGALTELKILMLDGNKLTGNIPESIRNITNIESLWLCNNLLSGEIPDSFYDWNFWKSWWGYSIVGNNYKFNDLKLPGPSAVVTSFTGKAIDLEEVYGKNKYTILHGWSDEGASKFIRPQLKSIYELYHNKGIEIVGWADALIFSKEEAIAYIDKEGMVWDNFYYDYNGKGDTFGRVSCYPTSYITSVTVVDSTGRIVFSDVFDRNIYNKDNYLKELLENDFKLSGDYYISTDYSQDGTKVELQKASEDNGINIVLLGDGYSDRQIADGLYRSDMEFAYRNLFTEEPYKSFKSLFNVSYVNVVSATEGYEHGKTALEGGFGDGTLVFGNDNTCFNYARKAVDPAQMNETLIIVVMNSDKYAGTCYMYYPNNSDTDYGTGPAVAYFPKGKEEAVFAQLLHHEACGHGFSKLADEYAYEHMGAIPTQEVEQTRNQQSLYGWWKNVDFTNDPAQVRWKRFLEDSRYANEGLGVFEGGLTYWSGVWRPTENSIMRHNTGGFNAPSREAIYYRIHRLAYGAEWQYDYEKFVEADAARGKSSSAATATKVSPLRPQEPLHPPVIVGRRWQDAR